MVVGVGIDVTEIDRFSRTLRRTPALAERLFTERERGLPIRSLAARFAAKEALAKALGGPRGLLWTDAEVVTGPGGKPSLKVTGTVARAARQAGVTTSLADLAVSDLTVTLECTVINLLRCG